MYDMNKSQKSLQRHTTFCSLPFTKCILNSWGEVSMCCHQTIQLGKLDDSNSILDIWNNEIAREIRKETTNGRLHKVCCSWNSCPFLVEAKKDFTFLAHQNFEYPIYLEICLPDKHCNVGGEKPSDNNPACIMCRRNFHTPDQQDLTEFLCEKSKPIMPHLRYFCVLGIAEPFWKDAVFKIMDTVEFEKYKEKITFVTNTNGICLNEKITKNFFQRIKKSDLSWSLDAATPETHLKIRRLDTFDLVVSNLRNWIKIRKNFGGNLYHKVCIYNNINMINVHEMVKMVELAAETQVDKMIMLPTHDQTGIVNLGEIILNKKNVNIFKKESEAAMQRAKDLKVNLHYSKRFDVVPPPVQS